MNITLTWIIQNKNNNDTLIRALRQLGYMRSSYVCEGCGQMTKEVKYKKNRDGMAFICYKNACPNFQKYKNIRINSFFHRFKINIGDLLIICYYFFTLKLQVDVTKDFNIHKNMVYKVYKEILRQITIFIQNDRVLLGGQGIICQIDESMFHFKQKYHNGRISQANRWVFGIIDTSTSPGKYYVCLVHNRSQEILVPIIQRVCREGTVIWSDMWRAYTNINMIFEHQTVNHRENYVNPISGVHTQKIESLWNKLKKRLKNLMGLSRNSLKDYLNTWMWIDNYSNGSFNNLLNLLN